MIIEVESASAIPPYEQIRVQLATMIGTGVLPPGAQLPTIRQLAADLGLAANTVARAYRELESEGLVVSRVRHGTMVTGQRRPLPRAEVRRRLAEAARAYAAAAQRLGVPVAEAEAAIRAHFPAAERLG